MFQYFFNISIGYFWVVGGKITKNCYSHMVYFCLIYTATIYIQMFAQNIQQKENRGTTIVNVP